GVTMPRTISLGLAGLILAALVTVPFGTAAADKADNKVIKPFNGEDLTGWKFKGDKAKSKWVVGKATLDEKDPAKLSVTPLSPKAAGGAGELINASTSLDFYTEKKFGDCTIEVEFMIPKGSNSGVYLMGEYEVQILDSYGKAKEKLGPGDMGGIYTTAAPKKNASKKPGEWQKFVIEFQAPKFEGEKKVANGKFIKVTFNDVLTHQTA